MTLNHVLWVLARAETTPLLSEHLNRIGPFVSSGLKWDRRIGCLFNVLQKQKLFPCRS